MVKNTRELIISAFIELAKQNPERTSFTMSEIAAQAGVSRQAIYQKHFSNVEDIIDYIHKETDDLILAIFNDYCPKKDGTPTEYLADKVFPLIYANRETIRTLYMTKADPNWRDFLRKNYSKWVLTNTKYNGKLNLSESDLSYLVTDMTISIIEMWIRKEQPTPPEAFKETFLRLVNTPLQDYIIHDGLDN